MTVNVENNGGPLVSIWRIAAWSVVPLVLLVPLIAMQFTDEVNWSVGDFVFAGALLIAVGAAFELAARKSRNFAYRAAVGVALAAGFLLIWFNGAVGIIGSEDNDANLMYFGVLAAGVVGALIARFRPNGMARALFVTAFAQALVALIAVIGGLGYPESGPFEILGLNGFFVAMFVVSGLLFRSAPDGR